MTAENMIMDALDLPPELEAVQDGYWSARREWQALEHAYKLVLADLASRRLEEDSSPA